MADRKRYSENRGSRELKNLEENIPDRQKMSQRSRARGSGRNKEHGEEYALWTEAKALMGEVVTGFNAESEGLGKLVSMDKEVGAMNSDKIPNSALKEMEALCRSGVKLTDDNLEKAKDAITKLEVLRAVVAYKENAEGTTPGLGKRGSTRESTAAANALYDFDGTGDSPIPSPIGSGSTRKFGERANTRDRDRDRDRERDRDSIPPRTDSVEPQGSVTGGASTPAGSSGPGSKLRTVFVKGESVAFKPKASNGESQSDWILGEVSGEGKNRRYKVLDIEPEDQSKQKEYRTSASSMIAIAPESQADSLPDWEPRTTVLALYPNTTTFYKAEVHSTADGRVNLKFEGENDSSTLQQVERRFVIEYRA